MPKNLMEKYETKQKRLIIRKYDKENGDAGTFPEQTLTYSVLNFCENFNFSSQISRYRHKSFHRLATHISSCDASNF